MLQIRADQLRSLARDSLVERLLVHARDVAPDICAEMTASHVRSIVDYCLERCEHYGVTRDYDIFRYLNLMLVFGVDFDKGEPWAAVPLAVRNPFGRMELLMDYALMKIPSSAEPEQ